MDIPKHQIVFDQKEIESAVETIANQINSKYSDSDLIILSVLKGAFIFTADLVRKLNFPHTLQFIQASSYGDSTQPTPNVSISFPPGLPIKDNRFLVVEDIFDTGNTINTIREELLKQGATSVETTALVIKNHDKKAYGPPPEYPGLECEDRFIFGYGMDIGEKYRNVPYIGVIS